MNRENNRGFPGGIKGYAAPGSPGALRSGVHVDTGRKRALIQEFLTPCAGFSRNFIKKKLILMDGTR